MPVSLYFWAFFLASLRMSSAICLSRSASVTMGETVVPIEARTRFETTDEREDEAMRGGVNS